MKKHLNRAGFTLLEATIAGTIVSVILVALSMTSQKATDAIDEGAHNERLVERLHRTLDQAIEPMSELELGALPPLQGGTGTVTFHLPEGYDTVAGNVQWGPDQRIGWELDPGETDDGVDNDGDGLIDEGQVVRTLDPGPDELRVVICKGVAEFLQGEVPDGDDDNNNGLVDEPGFCIDVQGEILTLRLTLESQGPQGRILRKTAESAIRIRN